MDYNYLVRERDGSVALRTTGPVRPPNGQVLICSKEAFIPSERTYDFRTRQFVRKTPAQETARVRTIRGASTQEVEGKQAARAFLTAFLQERPELRGLLECLVTLSAEEIRATLGETVAAPERGESPKAPSP